MVVGVSKRRVGTAAGEKGKEAQKNGCETARDRGRAQARGLGESLFVLVLIVFVFFFVAFLWEGSGGGGSCCLKEGYVCHGVT